MTPAYKHCRTSRATCAELYLMGPDSCCCVGAGVPHRKEDAKGERQSFEGWAAPLLGRHHDQQPHGKAHWKQHTGLSAHSCEYMISLQQLQTML